MSLTIQFSQNPPPPDPHHRDKLAKIAEMPTPIDQIGLPEELVQILFHTIIPVKDEGNIRLAEVKDWTGWMKAALRVKIAAKVLAGIIEEYTSLNQLTAFRKKEKNTETLLHTALESLPSFAPFYFALETIKNLCQLNSDCINDPTQKILVDYVNHKPEQSPLTPLKTAITYGHYQPFLTLLKLGARPDDERSQCGWIRLERKCYIGTPLGYCVAYERLDMAKTLLGLKQPNGEPVVDVNLHCPPLEFYLITQYGSALRAAVSEENSAMVELLLAHGAKLAEWDDEKKAWGGMIFDFIRERRHDLVIFVNKLSAESHLKQCILKEIDAEIIKCKEDIKNAQTTQLDFESSHASLVSEIQASYQGRQHIEKDLFDYYNTPEPLLLGYLKEPHLERASFHKILVQLRHNTEALRLFTLLREKLVKDQSLDLIAENTRALHLLMNDAGKNKEAWKKLADKILTEDPNDPYALCLLSIYHTSLKDYVQAMSYTDRCRSLYPDFWLAYLAQISIFLKKGDPAEAQKACQNALKLYPYDLDLKEIAAQCVRANQSPKV